MSAAPDRKLALEICALDRPPYHFEAARVTLPSVMGLFTVLPRHAPIITQLEIGVLQATFANGETHRFAVNGGIAKVEKDQVLVVTETAEMDTDIDFARAEEARRRAEERMHGLPDTADVGRAEVALKRAITRLRAAKHPRI